MYIKIRRYLSLPSLKEADNDISVIVYMKTTKESKDPAERCEGEEENLKSLEQ